MKDRLKALRMDLRLTQQAFADRLGIKGNTISQYESGRNEPIDAVVSLICREFHVNENWLRTGEGEMYEHPKKFDLNDYARERGASEFELNLVRTYFSLPMDVRTQMMDALKACVQQSEVPETDAERADRVEREKREMKAEMDSMRAEMKELRAALADSQEEERRTIREAEEKLSTSPNIAENS